MPVALLRAYLIELPRLHAAGQLDAAQIAATPHMKKTDRNQLVRRFTRALRDRRRARKATDTDLAALGIGVEQGG